MGNHTNRRLWRTLGLALGLLGACALSLRSAMAADVKQLVQLTKQGQKASAASQNRINALDDKTESLLNDYRNTVDNIEMLRIYNQQMQTQLASQQTEIDSLDGQIENATSIGRRLTPLVLKMIDGLADFVRLDVPFLPEERKKRIKRLRKLMDRSDVADSEKYRQVFEAYQIEEQYGADIQAYQDTLQTSKGPGRTVSFLRLGRVALLYRTLDGQEVGFWNKKKGAWQTLPRSYRDPIKKGIQMAKQLTAKALIRVPLLAPKTVTGEGSL